MMKRPVAKFYILLIWILIVFSNPKSVYSLAESKPLVGLNNPKYTSITGEGITVCLIDSGVDYTQASLGGCTQAEFLAGSCAKVIGGFNFCATPTCSGNSSDPMDDTPDQHGTNVAGILAGNGTVQGIAPKAKIVAVKAVNSSGQASDKGIFGNYNTWTKAVQWCIDNKETYNISIISMSLGDQFITYSADNCSHLWSQLDETIKAAYDANVTVVIASGNVGNLPIFGWDPYFGGSLAFPACAEGAISVGETYDLDFGTNGPISACNRQDAKKGGVTCTSNRNRFLDLIAPGTLITSFDTGYGTSYATPHVSGIVALLQDFMNATLRPSQTRAVLRSSGISVTEYRGISKYTYPRLDFSRAIRYLPYLDVEHADWPTENHDFRRTGFTLLEGDIKDANNVSKSDFVLSADIEGENVVRPSVADVDGNGKNEVVSVVHDLDWSDHSIIYTVENTGASPRTKFNPKTVYGGAVMSPPTVTDIGVIDL